MNTTPGSIITSTNSGDVAGSSPLPAGADAILSNMFAQMVTPEQIPVNGNKPVTPAVTPPSTPSPVVLTDPNKAPVKIEAKAEPDVNFFEQEPEPAKQDLAIDDEPDMSDIPDDPKAENWKKAREALRNERKAIKTLSKDFETTKSKLERYEKGEVVPEIITAKDIRISQLEKFETVVNGRLSEEYQTLVVKPAGEKNAALSKLADDYQVPENIREQLLQKIVETENEKERNSLITRYFPDAIGATKVESLVKELHELGGLALDMEKKPAEVMQTLQSQYQEKKQREAEVTANQFESVSKVSWTKALEKTAGEGLFPELILDPTNSEHNKVAEKNQHRAGIQYGALVKKLHQNGLKTLPEDLAVGMARAIQLSIGSVGIAKQLAAANERIAQLEGNNGMIATYLRPGVNSNGNGRPPAPANDKGPTSPQQAGQLAAQVFRK